ncbi:hypothetical protein CONPUDRAFT_75476 [Coniophora puteana RWD-64-598 SS2]|uniref:Uncharacterized protein n=1 Tax=Coniophora puteana (strain RWD-64-598) TaxID=741705 RepID=A0A5M3MF37_CONPW|nr:uncharacterized protein CONPUDRAFT_75476 [Coniophora puteana RWD-64-598 SS2]EIW77647.1 hypothetical protein CONPUDRAFT_75476 [Coniophora puteana RWD-64-598 SS2]
MTVISSTPADIIAITGLQADAYAQVSMAALVTYDCLLSLNQEKQKPSWMTACYVFCIASICGLGEHNSFSLFGDSVRGIPFPFSDKLDSKKEKYRGSIFYTLNWVLTNMLIMVVQSHFGSIVVIPGYTAIQLVGNYLNCANIWNQIPRWSLADSGIITTVEEGILLGVPGCLEYAEKFSIPGDIAHSIAMLVFDVTLIILVVYHLTWTLREHSELRRQGPIGIIDLLVRHSVTYFACLLLYAVVQIAPDALLTQISARITKYV